MIPVQDPNVLVPVLEGPVLVLDLTARLALLDLPFVDSVIAFNQVDYYCV